MAVADFPTSGLSQWKAPFTWDFACVVPKGTVFVAEQDSAPISTGFTCVPLNHKELEPVLVPEADRTAPKYNGYYFVFPSSFIGKHIQHQ